MALATVDNADRLARQVLTRRLRVKPKENVTIETYPSALPWATGFVREARRLGARPLLHYEDERSYWTAVDEGRADLVGSPGEAEWAALKESDVYVYFWGPEDQARLRRLPDATQEAVFGFNGRWYDVARKSGLRGVRMGIARANDRNARHWGVSRSAWEEEVFRASLADPKAMAKDAERVRRAFARGRSLRLRHANGTDLTLALAHHPVHVTTGEVTPEEMKTRFGMMANVPDGTVYVAVEETTADGVVVGNRTGTSTGAPVTGGRYRFKGGELTGLSFQRGGASIRNAYRAAGRGRERPSFIEVGLHPEVRSAPGLEEMERGAVTVGVGGNAMFGGKTKVDFLTYLTVAGAELSVDGKPLVRAGRIL
jgi:leucyl aminopeptidase (aminopeptidase T)